MTMTETTKEVLEKYQVRKTKKQKRAFAAYVEDLAGRYGYSFRREKGVFGAENLVVGDPDGARVVYTAHYDTAPVLPFPNFITPKNFFVYLLYQLALTVAILAVMAVIGFLCGVGGALLKLDGSIIGHVTRILWLILLLLLLAGPANRHTANDNTSGVTLLLDMMRDLPSEQREGVAFVFFDLEEAGLFGSASFARTHKKEMKDRLLLNFDCVSDGDHFLFALRKGARRHRVAIERAFAPRDGYRVEVAEKGVFYPSDQLHFPAGVGVAALRATRRGLLYMNRIHTSRDTVYREENLEFLKNGAIALPALL